MAPAPKEKIGIGLIGAGLIGTLHSAMLQTLKTHKGLPLELVHVADVELEKARRFLTTFKYRKASRDPEAVLRDPGVDAVYVCTWTAAHPELVKTAAAEKKHIFCEKPLAFQAGEAAAMQRAVESAGVIHQVGLVLRQAPLWNVLRDEIRRRKAGFPIALIFRDDQCFPIKGAHPSTWRKDQEKAGGGTLIEHSIHDLDLLEWVFGPVRSVEARLASRFAHAGIEDLAQVEIEFQSGLSGVLVSVWHDVERRASNRRLEVFYEKVFWALEAEFTGELQVMEGAGPLQVISEEEVNRRFWELRGITDAGEQKLSLHFGLWEDYLFCRRLLGEKVPEAPDFSVAVRAHQLVDACYESARKGERVTVLPAGENTGKR